MKMSGNVIGNHMMDRGEMSTGSLMNIGIFVGLGDFMKIEVARMMYLMEEEIHSER